MGDMSSEPSMEDILSSIKRIIAEEGDGPAPGRARRLGRTQPLPPPVGLEPDAEREDEAVAVSTPPEAVLELDHPVRADVQPSNEPEAKTRADAMLSARVAESTRGQLEALSRMVVKPDVAGSDTLEGMVRDMLKPMLSAWLDENLPHLVEKMVAREIARISGRDD